jgi:hypothetical protein
MPETNSNLQNAFDLAQLQDAAAGAYVTALGINYLDRRDEILDEIAREIQTNDHELKQFYTRVIFAQLHNADENLLAQLLTIKATEIALKAASSICGEPPESKAKESVQ